MKKEFSKAIKYSQEEQKCFSSNEEKRVIFSKNDYDIKLFNF